MRIRKKVRNRIIIFLLVVVAIIFWRGLKHSTSQAFDCEFKLIYAVCEPKNNRAVMPGLWEILKTGVEF